MKKIVVLGLAIIMAFYIIPIIQAERHIDIEPDFDNDDGEFLVPDYVQIGDIAFMDTSAKCKYIVPGSYNDHTSIYIGNNMFVEAIPERVCISSFTYTKSWAKNIIFGYVATANESQKNAAVEWAMGRIGQRYQHYRYGLLKIHNPYDPRPTAKMWYCGELVWAAYYHQGIDIDINGWNRPHIVSVNEIFLDKDVKLYDSSIKNN